MGIGWALWIEHAAYGSVTRSRTDPNDSRKVSSDAQPTHAFTSSPRTHCQLDAAQTYSIEIRGQERRHDHPPKPRIHPQKALENCAPKLSTFKTNRIQKAGRTTPGRVWTAKASTHPFHQNSCASLLPVGQNCACSIEQNSIYQLFLKSWRSATELRRGLPAGFHEEERKAPNGRPQFSAPAPYACADSFQGKGSCRNSRDRANNRRQKNQRNRYFWSRQWA